MNQIDCLAFSFHCSLWESYLYGSTVFPAVNFRMKLGDVKAFAQCCRRESGVP